MPLRAQASTGSVALLHAAGEIDAAGTGRDLAVHVQGLVLGLGVANGARVALFGAVGAAAVQELAGDADSAAGHREAAVSRCQPVLAVAGRRTGRSRSADSQPTFFFRPMSITPAIASEPYWAAAPSRSTCTSLIAITGMAFMSVPVAPRLRAPKMFTSEEVWRRLPFTSTRVWSELEAAQRGESTRSAPSAPVWRVELNDGEMIGQGLCQVELARLVRRALVREITSTGATVSVRELVARREPTTFTTVISPEAAWRLGYGRQGGQGTRAIQRGQDGFTQNRVA